VRELSHYRYAGDKRERTYSSYSFLTVSLKGVRGQRYASAALYPRGKDHQYQLDKRLRGPQSWSEHRGLRKNLCDCRGSNTGHRSSSL
jgi:hypothetical protein